MQLAPAAVVCACFEAMNVIVHEELDCLLEFSSCLTVVCVLILMERVLSYPCVFHPYLKCDGFVCALQVEVVVVVAL